MSKYIDAEKLIAEIERRKLSNRYITTEGYEEELIEILASLQQEQPVKVYRVENEKEQKGLWRKFDGTWEPLFDMLTDGQCKDMPMEDSPIYREGGKQWFASAPSKETLQKWFSKKDLEELIAKDFTISEFEVVGYKKISDFEYIFTRDSIISRTYLKVSDIYPQEQPKQDITEFEKALDSFGEAYATLVDRDNNPNQGIRINAYHELVQVHINEILSLAKEYVKQGQPEVDEDFFFFDEILNVYDSKGWFPPKDEESLTMLEEIARHFYELGLNARKDE